MASQIFDFSLSTTVNHWRSANIDEFILELERLNNFLNTEKRILRDVSCSLALIRDEFLLSDFSMLSQKLTVYQLALLMRVVNRIIDASLNSLHKLLSHNNSHMVITKQFLNFIQRELLDPQLIPLKCSVSNLIDSNSRTSSGAESDAYHIP